VLLAKMAPLAWGPLALMMMVTALGHLMVASRLLMVASRLWGGW
jgi:hypothetical protein